MSSVDLAVSCGPLRLKNPLVAASGCFGYGVEYADIVDLSALGAVAVKGLFLEERQGHAPPRIVETPSGMLNAIGLQGIGVRRFVDEVLPQLRARNAVTIVNICGTTVAEYAGAGQDSVGCPGCRRPRAQHLVPPTSRRAASPSGAACPA